MTAEQSEFSPQMPRTKEQQLISFQLLATSGCTLCDEAEAMLVDLLGREQELAASIAIEYVDISESDALVDAYGILIPVLSRVDAASPGRPGQQAHPRLELRWPFTQDDAHIFLTETPPHTP